ncbi:MAG: hypothetical protein QOJ50_1626 [Cryptosporangiaceae bacterium]|nr:hypothetical protein [Cryptosporangiaceae bacterium]
MSGPQLLKAPSRVPAGATADSDGIALGAGPATVEAYIDFLCPFCKRFEEQSGPALRTMLSDGLITLVYHPLAFLDDLSTTRYSSRAAASSGCASDGEAFLPYAEALFANQPPEGGPGLSNAELLHIGSSVGLGPETFGRCLDEGVYLPWAQYVTGTAIALGVRATPTVLVEGVPVPANARMIATAVASVVR